MLFNCLYLLFPWYSIVFIYFLEAFPQVKSVNLVSTVRYTYLSILPDDYADIFAASLLISYCGFSSLILSSIVITCFYILSKKIFL